MTRATKLALTLIVAGAVVLLPLKRAGAATVSNDLTVTASVTKMCVVSTGAISFGAYDPVTANATTPLDKDGTFTVSCTKGTGYTVALDNGGNFGSGIAGKRAMKSGTSDFLSYDIYSDTGYGQAWNSTGVTYPATTTKSAATLTAHGRIPAGQDVAVSANYSDTVVVTVTF